MAQLIRKLQHKATGIEARLYSCVRQDTKRIEYRIDLTTGESSPQCKTIQAAYDWMQRTVEFYDTI